MAKLGELGSPQANRPAGSGRCCPAGAYPPRWMLHLIGRGRANSEIAAELFLSETIVKTRATRISRYCA
jgi:hypothetical protein